MMTLHFLLIGELDRIADGALARRHHDQRLLSFQHRQHGFVFQIDLEALFLGSLGFLIAARVFEEFFQLAQLGLVVLLGIGEGPGAGKISRAKRPPDGRNNGKAHAHAGRLLDFHLFPGPAVQMNQRGLAGDDAAASAAPESASAARAHGQAQSRCVMPLARVTGMCSLAGLMAISARSCGSNFPISPTSTLSRMELISESPISVAESIMPG